MLHSSFIDCSKGSLHGNLIQAACANEFGIDSFANDYIQDLCLCVASPAPYVAGLRVRIRAPFNELVATLGNFPCSFLARPLVHRIIDRNPLCDDVGAAY